MKLLTSLAEKINIELRLRNKIKSLEAELEALQSRSCEGCKYFNSSINGGLCFRMDTTVSKKFYCQGHEPKEQL